jgi:hypothetical protein
MAERLRDERGRFIKQVKDVKATKSIASQAVNCPMLDTVGEYSAVVTFREIFAYEPESPEKFRKVENSKLMIAEFDQIGKKTETVVSNNYCFVPNNVILDAAEQIPGAEVKTEHFGMYYFGEILRDNIKIRVGNSYGGGKAFTLAPTITIRDKTVPVFLKTRQIHHGKAEALEFQIRETLAVSEALNDGHESIRTAIEEPMQKEDIRMITSLLGPESPSRKVPKTIANAYATKLEAGELRSYADVIVFIVDSIKRHMTEKQFTVRLHVVAENIIEQILSVSKIAATLTEALGQHGSELAREASHKIEKPKRSFRI